MINYRLLKSSIRRKGRMNFFTDVADPDFCMIQIRSRRKFLQLVAYIINRDVSLSHYLILNRK